MALTLHRTPLLAHCSLKNVQCNHLLTATLQPTHTCELAPSPCEAPTP